MNAIESTEHYKDRIKAEISNTKQTLRKEKTEQNEEK